MQRRRFFFFILFSISSHLCDIVKKKDQNKDISIFLMDKLNDLLTYVLDYFEQLLIIYTIS